MKKIIIYYGCGDGGDGSVYLRWFLEEDKAQEWESIQEQGWGDDCTGSVETFEDSNIHKSAIENSKLNLDDI